MTRHYNGDLSAAIHELAKDLHRQDEIDKKTICEFDESCLSPVEIFTSNGNSYYP